MLYYKPVANLFRTMWLCRFYRHPRQNTPMCYCGKCEKPEKVGDFNNMRIRKRRKYGSRHFTVLISVLTFFLSVTLAIQLHHPAHAQTVTSTGMKNCCYPDPG